VSLIHTYHLQVFHLIDHAVWFYARDDADVDDDDDKNKAGELVGASRASSAGVTPRRHGQGIVAEASNRRTNQLHGDSCRQPVMESRGPASVSPAPTPTRDCPSVLSRQQVCTVTKLYYCLCLAYVCEKMLHTTFDAIFWMDRSSFNICDVFVSF